MSIRNVLKSWVFVCLFSLINSPLYAATEKVKPLNPNCDVCPVVISYNHAETRNILGKTGKDKILKLRAIEEKTVKIDLDGLKKIGSENDSDYGYELLVFVYQHMIAINSIPDGSSIKLKTDFNDLIRHQNMDQWNPEIQLSPSNRYEIEKSDTLDAAWSKMKKSRMYDFINNSIDQEHWERNLGKFLMMILDVSLKS